MRKVGKSGRGQKIPRVPLWLSFLFDLGGQKTKGPPIGLFFHQLKGVCQKIDFFPKIFGSGRVNPPPPPPHMRIYAGMVPVSPEEPQSQRERAMTDPCRNDKFNLNFAIAASAFLF